MKTNLLQDELDNIEADALARKANLLAAAGRIAQCEILTQRLRRAGGDRICVRPFICAHTHGVPAMVRVVSIHALRRRRARRLFPAPRLSMRSFQSTPSVAGGGDARTK